ncbi:MAG TPA: Fic family protein [Alphaproteobacteria bacterium]|nr:Fic family protein [Alphaproteobacteria bacterium]
MNRLMTFGTFKEIKIQGESYKTYIPGKLSPHLIDVSKLYSLLDKATLSMGKLDAMSDFIPDINLFIYLYVRKEALLSSQIEGTQSSLADIFLHESDLSSISPLEDVEEVTNYILAINYALKRTREDKFPISLRLIKEIHQVLLKGTRGSTKNPGEFRSSQNWIGGSRPGNAIFVPPPPDQVMELMGDLEKFLYDENNKLPFLIKIAMFHVQFESIHPFLDGNGRLGRLLITLLLCDWSYLRNPVLYLSYYFKLHRQKYYDFLQSVRQQGNWEEWIEFFLKAIISSAEEGTYAAQRLQQVLEKSLLQIQSLGKSSESALQVFEFMKRHPVTAVPYISHSLNMSPHTVTRALKNMKKIGIIREITGKKRGKIYTFHTYLDILEEGSLPIA